MKRNPAGRVELAWKEKHAENANRDSFSFQLLRDIQEDVRRDYKEREIIKL